MQATSPVSRGTVIGGILLICGPYISTVTDWPAEASRERDYVLETGVKSTISIPLMIRGTSVGALAFGTFHKERLWSTGIVTRLRLVGEVIALGVRRHQDAEELKAIVRTMHQQSSSRNEQMRRLALELMNAEHHERCRISELLHEDVMQILALIGMYIEMAREGNADDRAVFVLHTKTLLQSVLNKLRNLAIELRFAILSKNGIVEGLRWLAQQMQQTRNLSVEMQVHDDIESIPKHVQLFILQGNEGTARQRCNALAKQSCAHGDRARQWRNTADPE